MAIMQGDNYAIPFTIKYEDEGEQYITPSIVDRVEFTIGSLTKTYPEEITYDSSAEKWLFPITQNEAFNLEGGKPETAQIRVKFTSGDIIGTEVGFINIIESISKGVL